MDRLVCGLDGLNSRESYVFPEPLKTVGRPHTFRFSTINDRRNVRVYRTRGSIIIRALYTQ